MLVASNGSPKTGWTVVHVWAYAVNTPDNSGRRIASTAIVIGL